MILLTGVSGFIGKHLLLALQKKFGVDNVVALTSKSISNGRFVLHQNYNFNADFLLKNGLEGIETIIHAGAFIPKAGSEANNWRACNDNIINTGQLYFQELPKLQKVIFLSTVDVYGYTADIVSESTAVIPATLYGDSKLYCEKMTLAFAENKNITAQILRIGHTYGPGEEAYQKVIPNTFKRLLNNLPAQIWGSGEELRAFIYIDDVILAIINSLSYDRFLGPINIVSKNAISIRSLVEKINDFSDSRNSIEYKNSKIKGNSLKFDNQKVKNLLLPEETSLETGLQCEFNYLKTLHEQNIL